MIYFRRNGEVIEKYQVDFDKVSEETQEYINDLLKGVK